MYLLYQVPGGKCKPNETSRQGAVRETFEEMGIDLKPRRLKFIAHDPKFDCNIYAHKIINVIPEQRELEEMSPWCQYPQQSFKILKERNKLTPSLIIFYWKIMEKIDFTLGYDYQVLGDGNIPRDVVKTITIPTLVMVGEKGMEFMHVTAAQLAKVMPNAEYKTLKGQMHQPKAEAMAPVLTAFFNN